MKLRFRLHHLLLFATVLASVLWYISTSSEIASYATLFLGILIGSMPKRERYLPFVFGAAIGGATASLVLSPFEISAFLMEEGITFSNLSYGSLFRVYGMGAFALGVIGFASGATLAQIGWLFLLVFRRYASLVDRLTRSMQRVDR